MALWIMPSDSEPTRTTVVVSSESVAVMPSGVMSIFQSSGTRNLAEYVVLVIHLPPPSAAVA